jgi:hypothetical protein
MVDYLTDQMSHAWNLINSDANNDNHSGSVNRLSPTHSLARKLSDHNSNHSNNNGQHHRHHQHQKLTHSPPMITTTDHSDRSSLDALRVLQASPRRKTSDAAYDTDGGIGTIASISKSPRHNNTLEHFVSPRLPARRSKQIPVVPPRQHSALQQTHLAVSRSHSPSHNHDDKDEELVYDGDVRRRHIRLSRRIPQRPSSTKNHGTHLTHPSTISRHDGALAATTSGQPFRLVFMRHSERVNQALGPGWFSKAFRTNSYQPYDENLPPTLPKRRFDQAYEFDTPLTGLEINLFRIFTT